MDFYLRLAGTLGPRCVAETLGPPDLRLEWRGGREVSGADLGAEPRGFEASGTK